MSTEERSEERFKLKVGEAIEEAYIVKGERPSRENSLAITNLEQAMLWCREDIEEKARKANATT